jgi:hypothetical protein
MTPREVVHARRCLALAYRALPDTSEEVMVVPQIYNASITRGRYLDGGYDTRW